MASQWSALVRGFLGELNRSVTSTLHQRAIAFNYKRFRAEAFHYPLC